ncbi:MAG: hypothetical protein PW788_11685 [Micavibrio sp.]|nr:hypothetical protein [Micavibrio sp.]
MHIDLPAMKKSLTKTFNWLGQHASRNYTLGEAFQHYAEKKPLAMIDDNMLGFTNAGRLLERAHVAAGVLSAAFIVAAAPTSAPMLLAAGTVLGLYKVMGLAAGKIADLAAGGRLYTPRPPQP